MINLLSEPAEPFTLFSYSDFLILILINLLVITLFKIRKLKINLLFNIVYIITFLFIIPYISNSIELNNVYKKFIIVDGFNLLYIFLKIPIWWIIGIIEYFLLKKVIKIYNYL